mmetsp:Transcript_16350/g.46114  ORF Transcript_16350/g.46114 Transcript_16350/m.46114 type:complete len:183 (-) Transcript_16350:1312-1860(-)
MDPYKTLGFCPEDGVPVEYVNHILQAEYYKFSTPQLLMLDPPHLLPAGEKGEKQKMLTKILFSIGHLPINCPKEPAVFITPGGNRLVRTAEHEAVITDGINEFKIVIDIGNSVTDDGEQVVMEDAGMVDIDPRDSEDEVVAEEAVPTSGNPLSDSVSFERKPVALDPDDHPDIGGESFWTSP